MAEERGLADSQGSGPRLFRGGGVCLQPSGSSSPTPAEDRPPPAWPSRGICGSSFLQAGRLEGSKKVAAAVLWRLNGQNWTSLRPARSLRGSPRGPGMANPQTCKMQLPRGAAHR